MLQIGNLQIVFQHEISPKELEEKTNKMDYSYLNQAAATFDTNCLQNGMDPTGLANMPCSYGDLTSCSQMSQAYRYTAAAASMARGYNPVGTAVGHSTAAMTGLHHATGPGSQCSVMGTRNHHQDVHRTSMFSTSMSMQCEFLLPFSFLFGKKKRKFFFPYFINFGPKKVSVRKKKVEKKNVRESNIIL